MDVQFTQHARDVIAERRLDNGWIIRALETPERIEEHADGTRHLLTRIDERGGRVLRVVVNPITEPPTVVTAFFDRRLKGLPR
jgi:hypothetical protein